MTAYLPKEQMDCVSPSAPQCHHPLLTVGLDRAYCPDCKREFKPWSNEYKFALKQDCPDRAATIAPLQLEDKNCSKAPDDSVAPDKAEPAYLSGADFIDSQKSAPDKAEPACLSGATPEPIPGADRVAPDKHWVETYSPAKRDDTYYRYVWMSGRKLHHIHIKGGNTKKALATARKEQVEGAIQAGTSPLEIEATIRSWGKKNSQTRVVEL